MFIRLAEDFGPKILVSNVISLKFIGKKHLLMNNLNL